MFFKSRIVQGTASSFCCYVNKPVWSTSLRFEFTIPAIFAIGAGVPTALTGKELFRRDRPVGRRFFTARVSEL